MEELPVVEPMVSEEYLSLGADVLAQIDGIFNVHHTITVKPTSLENSPYYLTLRRDLDASSYVIIVNIVLSDSTGAPIIFTDTEGMEETPGVALVVSDSDTKLRVEGIVQNYSNEALNSSNPAIRNITGVIAPYEDALCLELARNTGKEVIRQVNTPHAVNSQIVQNYLRRGYTLTHDSRENIMLEKIFPTLEVNQK